MKIAMTIFAGVLLLAVAGVLIALVAEIFHRLRF